MANNKPPLPPPAIAYLCDLTEEQSKGCGPEGPQVFYLCLYLFISLFSIFNIFERADSSR
jgi:hypothetical protein